MADLLHLHLRPALLLMSLAAPGAGLSTDLAGMWDGVMNISVKVPFRLEVRTSPPAVCFFEGSEPVCSTSAAMSGDGISARWDHMNVEVRLVPKGDGLIGFYGRIGTDLSPFITAVRHRPAAAPAGTAVQIGGTWEIHSSEKPSLAWRLILKQSGPDLTGTILKGDGDLGTFSGRVEGTRFFMSHFAGDRPLAIDGEVKAGEMLEFEVAGGAPRARYYALRPAVARGRGLPPPGDPLSDARVREPGEPFRFRFPDLQGKIVTEGDFAGRPFILSITGSWCPNCRDEAPFLAELLESYGSAGLAIAGLAFERASDPRYRSLKAFIERFAIRYPMLLGGEPGALSKALPQIRDLGAFPTTIFVARDGRIRAVHTGFPSRASGEERVRIEKEFRGIVESMLAETVRPSGTAIP